jgi:hypothetical protein
MHTIYLVEKSDGKRSFGRHRRRWEDNIKWLLHEYGVTVGSGFSWLRAESSGEAF